MSDLQPRGVAIEIDGVERHFLFTLNLIDELQDKYDKSMFAILRDLASEEIAPKVLREIVTALINREARKMGTPEVTEQDVGDMIAMDNYYDILSALMEAYGLSMPEPDDDATDPN